MILSIGTPASINSSIALDEERVSLLRTGPAAARVIVGQQHQRRSSFAIQLRRLLRPFNISTRTAQHDYRIRGSERLVYHQHPRSHPRGNHPYEDQHHDNFKDPLFHDHLDRLFKQSTTVRSPAMLIVCVASSRYSIWEECSTPALPETFVIELAIRLMEIA